MHISGSWGLLPWALCGALLVGCTSDGDKDEDEVKPAPTESVEAGGDICSYMPEKDLKALNPTEKEPVSTLLIGDLTFAGCTIGDVYSVSFGVQILDQGKDLAELAGPEAEEVDDVGDEAYIANQEYGGEVMSTNTVARFGDNIVSMRNDSVSNSNAEVRVSHERTLEALRAFAQALPDDMAATADEVVLDEDVCPGIDAAVITDAIDAVELARGGEADDAVRCVYRGRNGATLQLASSIESNAMELLGSHDPVVEIPGIADAEARLYQSDGSSSLGLVTPDNRLSHINLSSGDEGPIDQAILFALAEQLVKSSS